MFTQAPQDAEFSEAWIEGDDRGRWRSASGHGPGVGAQASGSSILEVDAGRMLPRHTDSAEELIVIVSGAARVIVGDETATAGAGAVTLVPAGVPHEVHNAGDGPLRFWAVYAAPEVTTTYEEPVQPDGGRERNPVG
jgi:mannose-6-phosphate isomerase-like protein (cupin superfamily)